MIGLPNWLNKFRKAVTGGGGGGSTTFRISGVGSARHDFTANLGYEFRPSANLTITAVGRMMFTGNTGSHTISVCDSTGALLQSASVNMSGGTLGTDVFTSITPVSLTSGVDYVILCSETLNGDDWGGDDVNLVTTADAVIGQSRYKVNFADALNTGTVGTRGYVPPNFKYTKP